jgi:hypothetical protein
MWKKISGTATWRSVQFLPSCDSRAVKNSLMLSRCLVGLRRLLELEIKHKHGGFNVKYEKATVVWQQFGFGL